ncbi:MAG TPA: NAD-dependent epimerase/dehydratase family protein, partial [Candidatus Paceibacterota bacterium]
MARNITRVNVAVVGGAGFIGSHLVNYLIDKRKCKVLVLDNLITGQKRFIHPKATFEHVDITASEEYIKKLFRHHKIKYVFNYAAEPYIPLSFARPTYVFNINASSALKIINAAWEAGAKGILQVSSAEIYGDAKGKVDEEAPVRPHSTYGAAKAAIDAMVQVRWKEAKTPVIALRQFNCLGERETHPYIIPEIIKQIEENKNKNKKVEIQLGNNSFRDFQYAGDAAAMAVELLEKGQFGEVYNMGSEDGVKMYDLAVLIGKLMGVSVTVKEDKSRIRPWEIWHLQSNNSKIYKT